MTISTLLPSSPSVPAGWEQIIHDTLPPAPLPLYPPPLIYLPDSPTPFTPPTTASERHVLAQTLRKAESIRTQIHGELIICGYGSPQVLDKQKHLITKEALAKDLPRFLANPKYRNANLLHTNIQVGEVLPSWRHPQTGELFTTKVDDVGLFTVVRIRTDEHAPPVLDEVIRDILSGKLAAFSISADAPFDARRYVCKDGTCFYVIDKIFIYEVTICQRPVNQDAKFSIVHKSADFTTLTPFYLPYAYCEGGTCPLADPLPPQPPTALERKYDRLLKSYTATTANKAITKSQNAGAAPIRDPHTPNPGPAAARPPDDRSVDRLRRRPDPARTLRSAIVDVVHTDSQRQDLHKAGYGQPNDDQDETQYLNKHVPTSISVSTTRPADPAPTSLARPGNDPAIPALPGDTGQHSRTPTVTQIDIPALPPATDPNDTLAPTTPDNDPTLQLGIYLQEPTQKPPLRPTRRPKLTTPLSGTQRRPSIMMSVDRALASASKQKLDLSLPTIIRARALYKSAPTPEWHSLATLALTDIARAARTTPHYNRYGLLRDRLRKASPLSPRQAASTAQSLLIKATELGLNHPTEITDPEQALSLIWSTTRTIVTNPRQRQALPDDLLATLDTLHEEAGTALDGIALQRALTDAHTGAHAPTSSPGIEHEILEATDTTHTIPDVIQADRLLQEVGSTPDPTDQYLSNRARAQGRDPAHVSLSIDDFLPPGVKVPTP